MGRETTRENVQQGVAGKAAGPFISLLLWAAAVLAAWLAGAAGAQQVSLPLERYEALRKAASAEPPEPPPPAAPVAFEEARLRLVVGQASARVLQNLTLSLFGEGWRSLALPAAGSFVAADLGDLDGVLRAEGGWALRMRGAGRHALLLESAVPVEQDEGAARPTWRLALDLPAAAVVHGEIDVPDEVVEVEAQAGGVVVAADGRYRFVGEPGAALRLTLFGTATRPERDALPLRFEAVSASAVELSRGRVEVRAWIEAKVLQGRLETLAVPLPSGFELVAADGAGVAGWDVEAGRAVITPLEPVEDRLEVALKLAGAAATVLESPLLAPEGAERVAFLSKVAVEGDGILQLEDAGSGRRVEARDQGRMPEAFAGRSGLPLAVASATSPPRWAVSWADSTEVLSAQVDRLLVEVLAGTAGRAYYRLWAEVRNTGAPSLTLRPPAGFELVECRRDGSPLTPGAGSEDLVLPLRAAAEPQVFSLAGFLPLALPEGDGVLELRLPAFSAPVSRVGVRLLLPESHSARPEEAGRRGAAGLPPAPAFETALPPLARHLLGVETAEAGATAEGLLEAPSGFTAIEAAWSTLSPEPSPLVLRLEKVRERKEWF